MVPDFHIYHIWETVWVFLQNPYPVTPVMVVKMVPKAVIGPQGPRASSKVSWALRRAFRETDVKYLRNVFRLTDRQLVPFNFRLHPTHTPSVHFHQSHSKFHSTVRAGGPSSQSLTLYCPPSCTTSSHRLLRHPRPECSQLTCHGF